MKTLTKLASTLGCALLAGCATLVNDPNDNCCPGLPGQRDGNLPTD